MSGTIISIDYTNWRGERSLREIVPQSIRFGTSEWHTTPQWLLLAFDIEKRVGREFALDCIHEWKRG